ncbi:hypothetical protein [Neobacillus sp. PS3-40]|uniref:hypothetical protein n=1 Tax=Neobacillus sp. PS3-40 TaxID=3070679 RepID=UPI0027E11E79|nr:hypothetical protein [Neobacillus sp. PS3-40]WML42646.1 hypothetical protein RCG20_12325 [Neobacillus sp. PS3-40]
MAKEGYYSIKVNPSTKTIDMVVSGTFTPEKALQFVNDYQSKVGTIKAGEFILKCDCRELDVVTQDMIPDLENCYRLYQSSGFNKVVIEIKKSPVIKMQLSRIGRNTGLTNLEFVEV